MMTELAFFLVSYSCKVTFGVIFGAAIKQESLFAVEKDIAHFYAGFSSRLVSDLTIEQLIYGNLYWVCRNTKRSSQRYSSRSNNNAYHVANQ